MKTPYYMVMHGENYVRVTRSGRVKLVDWGGSRYQTKEQAEVLRDNGNDASAALGFTEPLKVVEILEDIRRRI